MGFFFPEGLAPRRKVARLIFTAVRTVQTKQTPYGLLKHIIFIASGYAATPTLDVEVGF